MVRPVFGVRTWAILLVLSAVLPLFVFGWVTLHWITRTQADMFTRTQTDTGRVLANSVDGELHAWKAALTGLAASQVLQRGDLAAFDAEARSVAAQHDGWIVLTSPTGQQLVNTLRPYGSPLPTTSAPTLLQTVTATKHPVVSDLIFSKVAQHWSIAVAAPIMRDGQVTGMLDMSVAPDRLTRLFERQRLPADWILAILDSEHRVVTRVPFAAERTGQPVQPWLDAALQASEHGFAAGPLLTGVPVRTTFNRLTEAPWTVAVAIPLAAFPSRRPLYQFLALGMALAGCAIALMISASRKLTRPVAALAAHAEGLLRGEALPGEASSPIREIAQLRTALVTAAAHVQARNTDLQRLTGELALAEQRERQRLAHVLHDGLQQLLVAAQFRTTVLDTFPDPTIHDTATTLQTLLADALTASRSLTAELSPPVLQTGGLVPALQWLARWMQETHGLAVRLLAQTSERRESEAVEVLLFNAVRELLFNVVKHAGVREASVAVTRTDDHVHVVVSDKGAGFDPARIHNPPRSGLGLASIRQRLEYLGGTITIQSAPGQGSRFTLTILLRPTT